MSALAIPFRRLRIRLFPPLPRLSRRRRKAWIDLAHGSEHLRRDLGLQDGILPPRTR